ncbi:MAG: hypothetical protein JWP12_2465 [Bacteroidetes bacterium]|nr:hypothetical protein [Bacteroidota bacterium]
METPSYIQLFYDNLDEVTSTDKWDLLKLLRPIEEKIDASWEDNIKTERKILSFEINAGRISSETEIVDANGAVSLYPDKNSFTKEEIEYLKLRALSSKGLWIKSRYTHVLFESTKNNQYSAGALDLYIQILKALDPYNEKDGAKFSFIIECIIPLLKKNKAKIIELKSLLFNVILIPELASYEKRHIIEILFNSGLYPVNDFRFCMSVLKEWVDCIDGSYFHNEQILTLALKLCKKLAISTNEYYELLAENQDLIIKQHPDDKDFLKCTHYGEKAKYYKLAKNFIKYEEASKIHDDLKSKYVLGGIPLELPPKVAEQINDYLNARAKWILSHSPGTILGYFATGADIFPKNGALDRKGKKMNNFFMQFCSIQVFDINSNHKNLSEKEAKELEEYRSYALYWSVFTLPLFIKTMILATIQGKISYHAAYKYMLDSTWYGQTFPNKKRDIDDETTWLSLLAPGLFDFFNQYEWAVTMHKNYIPSYILCVDSLTLKFEGAIRDYIRLLGGTTTTSKKGDLREQLLEELLQNKTAVESINAEDLVLFKYVFTKSGWNIRNNVAHCFYPYSNYTFDKAALIFLCILRLGRYRMTQRK